MEISPLVGGACRTRGGSRLVILSAGYIGSLVWGGVILLFAARTNWDRTISLVLGVIALLIGLIFVRPIISFGQLFVVGVGVGLFGCGTLLPLEVNDIVLRIIGTLLPLEVNDIVLR